MKVAAWAASKGVNGDNGERGMDNGKAVICVARVPIIPRGLVGGEFQTRPYH
jgi:hypothetical protein